MHLHSRAVLRSQGEDGVRFSRLVMPPAAPSFPPCRKRRGRKGALVTVWCVLRVRFRQVLIFGYYEHTYSPYGRYGTRRLLRDARFVSRCVKIAAMNQLCVQILQDSTDSPQAPKASHCHAPRGKGRWQLRQQMPERICCKVQSAPEFTAFESPRALRVSSRASAVKRKAVLTNADAYYKIGI